MVSVKIQQSLANHEFQVSEVYICVETEKVGCFRTKRSTFAGSRGCNGITHQFSIFQVASMVTLLYSLYPLYLNVCRAT